MTGQDMMINEQALDWVIRTRDPDFADWAAFTAWLESTPGHALAYDAIAAHDAALPAMLPPVLNPSVTSLPVPANDPGVPGWKRWRWAAAGAVAAALIAIVSVSTMQRAQPYTVATGAGERRDIALADGTRIALNGDTVLRLDQANPRLAALDRGEAMFTVKHDSSAPFRVNVGGAVLEDVGTIFNVRHVGGMTQVGVSEGAVLYNPEREAIALPAGRALRFGTDMRAPVLQTVTLEAVGSWRTGRLIYADAPLGDIASDIGRNLGVVVRVDRTAGAGRFTGTIRLDRDPARFFTGAAPLLGVQAVPDRGGWLLKAADVQPD